MKHLNYSQIGEKAIYVKSVAVADLPDDVKAQAGELETVFAVHNSKGEQLAIVAHAEIASRLAADNQMQLVTLH